MGFEWDLKGIYRIYIECPFNGILIVFYRVSSYDLYHGNYDRVSSQDFNGEYNGFNGVSNGLQEF